MIKDQRKQQKQTDKTQRKNSCKILAKRAFLIIDDPLLGYKRQKEIVSIKMDNPIAAKFQNGCKTRILNVKYYASHNIKLLCE